MLDAHESLSSAASVLVIGGGTVGVEFAGEIASAFPNKDITLAHTTIDYYIIQNLKCNVKHWSN